MSLPQVDWLKRKRMHTEYALSVVRKLPFTPIILEIHYSSSNLASMPPSYYWIVRGDAVPVSRATAQTLNRLLHLVILPNRDEILKWK